MLTIEEGWIRGKGPNNVSLPKHCMTVLIGRNGSGKTTLLKGLAKQLDLESGKLYYPEEWGGTNYHHYVGYTEGKVLMYRDFTIEQSFLFLRLALKKWQHQYAYELAELFELDLATPISSLSKGKKQLYSLLVLLVQTPAVLLLDEITDGVDSISRLAVQKAIQAYLHVGDRLVCIASHITEDLDAIADNLVFMHDGKVVLSGYAIDLRETYSYFEASPEADLTKMSIYGQTRSSYSVKGICLKESELENDGIYFRPPTVKELFLYVVEGGESK